MQHIRCVKHLGGMKRGVFLLLCLLAFRGHGQTPPPAGPEPAHYVQVVPVPGASADELYARAREWVALTFEDAHQVLQLEDAPRHLLLGSGYTQAQSRRRNGAAKSLVPLWFRFRVETREGRYRVELTDLASVQDLSAGQYAAGDIAQWLSAGHATRAANWRHGAPGQALAALLGSGEPEEQAQVKAALDEAMSRVLSGLQTVETAAAAAW